MTYSLPIGLHTEASPGTPEGLWTTFQRSLRASTTAPTATPQCTRKLTTTFLRHSNKPNTKLLHHINPTTSSRTLDSTLWMTGQPNQSTRTLKSLDQLRPTMIRTIKAKATQENQMFTLVADHMHTLPKEAFVVKHHDTIQILAGTIDNGHQNSHTSIDTHLLSWTYKFELIHCFRHNTACKSRCR